MDPIKLGAAAMFTILAYSNIGNLAAGTIVSGGSMGVYPGSEVTGFPPGVYTNEMHIADDKSLAGRGDAAIAYTDANGRAVTESLTGVGLGGLTLVPGVYNFGSTASLAGDLVLDGTGVSKSDRSWIFQVGSALSVTSGSSVSFVNGEADDVTWALGSAAVIGTDCYFAGNIIAYASVSVGAGTIVDGRLIGLNEGVSLNDNLIRKPGSDPDNTDQYTGKSDDDGLSEEETNGIIAGAVIGGVLILFLIGLAVYCMIGKSSTA